MLRSVLHRAPRRLHVSQTRSITRSPPEGLGIPQAAHVPGGTTTQLKFLKSVLPEGERVPAYSVLDGTGNVLDGAELPEIDEKFARRMYENMCLLPAIDSILYNIQRQGKISFYMTSLGEEAAVIGTGAALADDDEVLGQYRETGVLLWRGFGLPALMNQCFGNKGDHATKGRQMPVHYGSRELHFHTISSPLGTQIPQAAGVGYALKRDPARRDKNIAAVYMGEGAASEGDFHAGMLLSATIPTPTLFLCRNNGFAISTPSTEQYGTADGIVVRGPGYGLPAIRVDGNDVLAVLSATRAARKLCLETGRGVLLEAMTYRVGHHSTSDDSFAYRPRQEVEARKKLDDPIGRFRAFLIARGWWDEAEEEALRARLKQDVLKAYRDAEGLLKHPLKELFSDVYAEEPWNIKEQREELTGLLKKYGQDWEPWKNELKTFEGGGKDLTGETK